MVSPPSEETAESFQAFGDAAVEVFHPGDGGFRREREGDEEMPGLATHGGEVRDDAGNGFPTDGAGGAFGRKMDVLDERVGFQKEQGGGAGVEDGAIVAGAWPAGFGSRGTVADEAVDQGILTDVAERFHEAPSSGK